ncbi:hypothetical protein GCM10027408_30040 [Microbacterium tumbae]
MSIVLGVIGAILASGWATSGAAAVPPLALDSGFVTDDAGVLSGDQLAAANDRLEELADSSQASLFVVFVDGFTDPADNVEWADTVAIDNGLGDDQYLIAIDVSTPQYGFSASSEGVLAESQLDAIEDAFVPEMRAENWAGVITAAADAFPGPSPIGWILLALVVVAAVVVLIVVLVSRARKRKRGAQPAVPDPNDPFSSVSDADLETQAGGALVAADDAVTASKEELGFAVAQFGDDSTTAFADVVEQAKAKLSEAFALKQQLDDEVPDTAEQRRAWHIQIIQLCDAADDLLEANAEEFAQLRKLAAEAPQALERLRTRRVQSQQIIAAAPGALASLAQTYDAAALSTVAENATQAQDRLALADREIAEAETALAANATGEAAFSIRTAEQALAQGEQLTAAVATLGADLAKIEDQAKALIAELEADLAAAAQLPDPQGQLASVIAGTRAQVSDGQAALQTSPRNPQRALDALAAANAQIDGIVAQVRDALALAQRNAQLLQQRITQAQAQISAADQFITTRRGGIGATARTRLAEAQAALSQAIALQATDPTQALNHASRAYDLAQAATSAAQADVTSFDTGGWGGGYGGGYRGDSGLGGDILGGILGGLISGGGRSSGGGGWSSGGGGWSSGGGGWSSGGGGRGGGGRSYRPSSFGGSSRSSSRSSSRGSSRGGR